MSDPVAWPFFAGGEFSEQLDFLTDIMPAGTGPEQRNRLRSTPHLWLGFNGLAEGDERRRLEQLLHANGAGTWWLPWPMEGQPLASTLALGSTVIPVDTRWRHYAAGGRALLVRGLASEVVQIESLTTSELVLSNETVADWPAGSVVYPCFRARLDSMIEIPRFTGDAGGYAAKFRNDEPVDWPANAGAVLYRGLPVLDIPVEWTVDPADVPDRALEEVGNEISLPFVYDPVGQPRNRIRLAVTVEGLEHIAMLRSLFYALAGCWSVIWVPSKAQDLRIVANVSNGATTLDVAYVGLGETPLADNRRDVRITLFNGMTVYRRITGVTSPAPGVERLTLDSAIATGFQASSVAQIAFLQLCRQEADTSLLTYWRHDVVRTNLEFRGEAHHGL